MPRRGWILWILVLVAWTLVGLSFTLNYYFFAGHYVAIFKHQPTVGGMLVWELPYWFLWAALAPLIFQLTRWFRIGRDGWLRNSVIHILACLTLAFVHRAVYLIVGWALHVAVYRQYSSVGELYESDMFFNLPTGYMSYGTFMLISLVVDYYRRYQREELRASRLKAELAQAQLQALKMQLQPHFLFNTLNSISALLDEDADAADEMIARLGDFLRMTLENSGAQRVTLQEEMEFLRCYLEIEHVRFQDRLTVSYDIAPDVLDALVPNLILQPIVENAIRHGVVMQAGPGRINVRASHADGLLVLRVSDNGPGLAAAQDSSGRLRGGVGLSNTRSRLEHLYGAAQRFEMADAREGGLQVTLEIPFEKAETSAQQRAAIG
ncbi:MAG TPA: histidine kinase [Blastocatellia bacterium]|nr:histidine kinase [Blastocatellia bacterium]